MTHESSRRDFLRIVGGASVAVAHGTLPEIGLADGIGQAPAATVAPGELMAGWFDRPMRWVQLTLVENDPGRFDPAFWLDYFKRLHADAATLSAGGIVAYYPTKIALHHRSAWLGESDPFGALVAGCRAMNMHILARTDP